MRTFLTYVLAALAASVTVVIFISGTWHVDMWMGIASGEYRVLALLNLPIEISFRAVGYFIFIGSLTYLARRYIWMPVGASVGREIVGGIVLTAVTSCIVTVGGFIWSNASGQPLDVHLPAIVLEVFVAGAAWGAVFWLRTPKSDMTEVAA